MPFASAQQEIAMKINAPGVWRRWVSKYGHHPGYKAAVKRAAKKAAKTKRSKRRGRRR